jgi:hypothetical protein
VVNNSAHSTILGAMAGIFTGAAILLILIGIITHMAWMRRRRRSRKMMTQRGRPRAGSPSAFSYVEPPISRPSPSLRFSLGSATNRWWTGHKRGSAGFFSQDSMPLRMDATMMDRKTMKSSESVIGSADLTSYRPSGEINEMGHIYGRVRGIPDSSTPPLVSPAYPPMRTMVHGRQTTLEDALLPSSSSSPFHLRSPELHPYAQGR